ncbi:MAG: acetate--CoA ligase family protein [Thermoplasmata archaeon]
MSSMFRSMLENLFHPKSIAIVGASRDKDKIGNILLRNIKSTYQGIIYPVNNKVSTIENIQAYKSLKDIKAPVDLVIISIPREGVPEIMQEVGEIGTKVAVIITSGFREVDEEGAKLEEQVSQIAKKYGIRFLGPNTMGFTTPAFNATFAYADVKIGNIAIVAQSGGMGAYMLDWAQRTKTGLSYFVSLGNQTDINEIDIFEFLADDINTSSIFTYLEGVADGTRFLSTVPDITAKKPIIFIKGGTGKYGAQAVQTHTGSIAGSIELFRAAVKTVGGVLVDNLDDFLNMINIIQSDEKYLKDILVITNSGGHGVLTTDEIERESLSLVSLTDEMDRELRKILPDQSKPKNPLDLSGDANGERYRQALDIVQNLECTKLVLVQALAIVSCTEVAKVLIKYKGKRVVGVLMGSDSEPALRILTSAGIPAFSFPEDAVKAIKYVSDMRAASIKYRTSEPISGAMEIVKNKQFLNDEESFRLLELYGIRVPAWSVVSNLEDAKKVAAKIGFPVVMKVSSDEPIHKTEIGGVIMNVEEKDVEKAFNTLISKAPRVMIQQQLNGVEVFIGGLRDPAFGPAVLIGPGGIYVEVIKSISYGLSPVSEDEALEMLKESKVYSLLNARKRNYNISATVSALTRISRMIEDLNIKEMDINPLIVNENNAYATDVRIIF